MTAYYNEIDEYAAQWLRNLIAAGHIAPGDVDTRSITEVKPHELAGYTQCHFFAGIGVWSHALRRAGWSDSRPVWTGSCPCQPFSAAGKGAGFADDRHLWPDFQRLIAECAPPVVFGEQVASKATDPWFDLVQTDLEALGYAFGCVAFPAASVGAPHIRDRAYWVAHSLPTGRPEGWPGPGHRPIAGSGEPERLANTHDQGPQGWAAVRQRADQRAAGQSGVAGRLADAAESRHAQAGEHERGSPPLSARSAEHGGMVRPTGPLHGFWSDADWLLCRDGKWRPVEPGTFPLAHGITNRVGRLRAYGNAICAEAAVEFIKVAMEYRP